MENKEYNGTRRKLLKTIAAGSGVVVTGKLLPESWVKPVVSSVLVPAHAQTSTTTTLPPTTTLTYSCSITGETSIFVGPTGTQVAVDYTITNTGTGPLTGGSLDGAVDHGTTGNITNVTDNNPAVPDPFAPGGTITYTLNAGITTANCPDGGGAGTLTLNFTSNETNCNQVIDVTCPGPVP